jgi:VanZ family protein
MRWLPGNWRYLAGCAIVAAYPALTLFPYDWTPPVRRMNGASFDDTGAIEFTSFGIARSDAPPPWVAAAMASHQLELHLRVRPTLPGQTGPARIFTLSADTYHRNLTVGQQGEDLIIRLRTPSSDRNGLPQIRVPGVMDTARTVDVHLLVKDETAEVRIDGATRGRIALGSRPLAAWDPGYRLALGNELTLDRPWQGRVERAEVRTPGFTMDYAAPGSPLDVPSPYWAFHQPPQLVPFRPFAPGDIAVNILFFIPLGFIIGMWRRGRSPTATTRLAIVVGFALSLSLEVLQLFIPTRQPALTDIILNTLGAALGVLVARRWIARSSSRSTDPPPR